MNKKGITLMELIIVMAIIALGAVLMVPNIGAWLPNYRLRSATRDIVSTMRLAQMKAVSTNVPYTVTFDEGNNSYIVQYQTTSGLKDDGATQRLPAGITMSADFEGLDSAVFNPNSTASSGNLRLQNTKGGQKTVTLFATTGRVRID